jgi:hypothetical protein
MTPKEKAEELFVKFIPHTRVFHEVLGWENYEDSAKQCAVIAVETTIQTLNEYIRDLDVRGNVLLDLIDYWREVKQEIDKL